MKPPTEDYDDGHELTEYIGRNRSRFLTPFEQRVEQMGMLREKARHAVSESPDAHPAWAIRALNEYHTQADDAIRGAIGDDLSSFVRFQDGLMRRIELAFKRGELLPNRCPKCSRIVKTPKAKQCLWCGCDWHNEAEE